ncbi:MAG TPA: hypothetical protein VD905_10200 [Flavobacteriales bacterium]|nr:hypothetical protein [Flavobacteriales bacterium]
MSNPTANDRTKEHDNQLVFSYMTLRNLIGFAGMLLPIVLIAFTKREGGLTLQPSISDYYYTNTGDVLVVILCILAAFLVTYNGYGFIEKCWAFVAAAGAVGVAFNPTDLKYDGKPEFSIHVVRTPIEINNLQLHLICALLFFVSLIVFSMYYFNKPPQNPHTAKQAKPFVKAGRKWTHYICGLIMIGCLVRIGIYFFQWGDDAPPNNPTIFWCESIALWAFGISWLTKGETLWPKGTHYMVRGIKMLRG